MDATHVKLIVKNGGANYGEYHCHNSGSSSISSDPSTSNEETTTKVATQKLKSSDNTLKEIIIDDKSFEVKDNINYKTKNENVNIEAITNDNNATYEVINDNNLSIGENKTIIVVKAEDGTIKNYIINITREIILSSNTSIKITINDKEINFDNYKATIYVDNSDTKIDLDYKLDDDKSKIEYDAIDKLKVGNNNLKIKVIAEDGSEQVYNIVINRSSKIKNTFSIILGLGIVSTTIYNGCKLVKKRKKNIRRNKI